MGVHTAEMLGGHVPQVPPPPPVPMPMALGSFQSQDEFLCHTLLKPLKVAIHLYGFSIAIF